jgi:hypothetical protein
MKRNLFFLTLLCFLIISCKNPNDVVLNYSDSKTNWVSNKTVERLHQNYLDDPNTISSTADGDPSRFVYFKLDELKDLVWQMESAAKTVYPNGGNPEMGISVYFTQYPDSTSRDKDLGTYQDDRNTVILVPSFQSEKGVNNFDPRKDKANGGKEFTPWALKITPRKNIGKEIDSYQGDIKKIFYFPPGDDDGTNLNYGKICPDHCPITN